MLCGWTSSTPDIATDAQTPTVKGTGTFPAVCLGIMVKAIGPFMCEKKAALVAGKLRSNPHEVEVTPHGRLTQVSPCFKTFALHGL